MPIYEFQCKSCLRSFEELVCGTEAPTCPHCRSAQTEKLISRPCACRGSQTDSCSSSPAQSRGGCGGCAGGSCASCH